MARDRSGYDKKRRELRKRKEKRRDKSIGWDRVGRDEGVPIDSGHSDPRTAPPPATPPPPAKKKAPPPQRKRRTPPPTNTGQSPLKKKKGCGRGLFFMIILIGIGFAVVRYINQQAYDSLEEDWMDEWEDSFDTYADEVDLSDMGTDGEELFMEGCSDCHLTREEDLLGPGLADIEDRQDAHWIYAFLKNPDKFKQNDDYAYNLDHEYEYDQPKVSLSFKQLEAILAYIEEVNQEELFDEIFSNDVDTTSADSDLGSRLGD